MSVLGDIRAGLVQNLSSLDANCSGYLYSDPPTPCFEIDFQPTTYGPAFSRGADTLQVIVRGIVQLGEETNAQSTLDEWLDPSGLSSVKAALESDRTLGGKCDDLFVQTVTGHQRLATPTKPNATLLCAEWTVLISITP